MHKPADGRAESQTYYNAYRVYARSPTTEGTMLINYQRLVDIPLSPANLTIAIHFTSGISQSNLNKLQRIQNSLARVITNTSKYQHIKPTLKKLHWLPIKQKNCMITNSVLIIITYTKHSQINNLHIFTIVLHFRHTLFLHDLLIHSFYPFHMSDRHLANGPSLSSVHDFGIHYLPIPKIRILYQLSFPGSKHTSSKLHSLPRLFPISLDCLPGF